MTQDDSEFDRDTSVVLGDDGTYTADLRPGWVVGGGVNGGYLLASLGRALGATVPGKPDPIAISAYYLAATTPGPASMATRVVRDGGSVATLAADLRQGDTLELRRPPRRPVPPAGASAALTVGGRGGTKSRHETAEEVGVRLTGSRDRR